MYLLKKISNVFRRATNNPWRTLNYLWGYLVGCLLTLRYVDEYNQIPAIVYGGQYIRLSIRKSKHARLCIRGRLRIDPFFNSTPSSIGIGCDGQLIIRGDFIIGEGVHIKVGNEAILEIGGRNQESGSGITADSIIMVLDFGK